MRKPKATVAATLPSSFLRVDGVASTLAKGMRAVYRDVRKGLLTPSIVINAHHAVWPRAEIECIQAAWVAGANEEQVRALVVHLVKQRPTALERAGGPSLAALRAMARASNTEATGVAMAP